MPRFSVVIPAWNDALALGRTLDYLGGVPGVAEAEVIVAASGDPEGTERAVSGRALLLWPDGSTRAALMNAGAEAARGEVLFFLHADSFPPANGLELMDRALCDARVVGGAFEHLFAEPAWSLRAITWINRIRYRLTGNYYGDQGLFVRVPVFRRMGGYRDVPLLEDLDFSQRLRRQGWTALIRVPMLTSGRRFLARGPWRTFCFIVWLLLLHTLRLDTRRYAERWRGPAGLPPGSPWRPGARSSAAAERPENLDLGRFSRRLLQAFLRRYARAEASAVAPFVAGRRVLDLGAGEGYLARELRGRLRVWICSVDVGPFRRAGGPYVAYDGARLPFGDGAFDTALIVLALHHCSHPERVLDEAIRVSRRRLIVIESVYRTRRDLFWLNLLDGRLNRYRLEGRMNVPRAFRRPAEWRSLFESRGLRLVETRWLGTRWERLVHHPLLFVLDKADDAGMAEDVTRLAPREQLACDFGPAPGG